jgi:hypothetical protein
MSNSKKTIKWLIAVTVIGILVSSLVLVGCTKTVEVPVPGPAGPAGPAGEPGEAAPAPVIDQTHLVFTVGLGMAHASVTGYCIPLMDRIEAESGGRIKFIRFFGGELVPYAAEYDAMMAGTADMGLFSGGHIPSVTPLDDITLLPIMNADGKLIMEGYQQLCDSDVILGDTGMNFYDYEYTRNDLKAWAAVMTGTYQLTTLGD